MEFGIIPGERIESFILSLIDRSAWLCNENNTGEQVKRQENLRGFCNNTSDNGCGSDSDGSNACDLKQLEAGYTWKET